jgi:hypothetical protein
MAVRNSFTKDLVSPKRSISGNFTKPKSTTNVGGLNNQLKSKLTSGKQTLEATLQLKVVKAENTETP